MVCLFTYFKARREIQGDSGGKVNTSGGDNFRHCEEKLFICTLCLFLNNQRDGAL